ncbi:hypothetical protein A3B57_03995 [Microgenomates group bacterium RIFCSPLOWO2_01_FULL_47_10]|nr:MAG: hypothetical protein A3B57_03995 [Microgenomates group bacterium RIFCSPLOWO2_01_FULL_47_10]
MKPTTYAVILAGGIGRRFKPFQQSKPLFPIQGSTLIGRNVEKLLAAGIKDIVIVTNPADEVLLRPLFFDTKTVRLVIQANPYGMANALLSVENIVGEGAMLVLNAADQVEQSLFDEMASCMKKHQAFVVGRQQKTYFNGGYLVVKNSILQSIVEKPGEGKQPSDLVNLVFHYFPVASVFIGLIKKQKSESDDHYEQALNKMAKTTAFAVIKYKGYWQPVKYPWDILTLSQALLESELKPKIETRQIAKSAIIDKNVYLGPGVIVHEHAVIKGPSYVGPFSVIGNHAFVRQSYIGSDCVIGTGSEVARSYIGDHSWLHQNYVGDSVLESNVAMGAGSVIANFRLDEQPVFFRIDNQKMNTGKTHLGAIIASDVRIGVEVAIMPGVKIGHNSIVGPGSIVGEDIGRFTRVFVKPNLKKIPFKGTISKR